MVYQVAQTVDIPILGLGGISNGYDAIEFMLAGATAVSIGTGNFISPDVSVKAVGEIEEYMRRNGLSDVKEIIGKVQMN